MLIYCIIVAILCTKFLKLLRSFFCFCFFPYFKLPLDLLVWFVYMNLICIVDPYADMILVDGITLLCSDLQVIWISFFFSNQPSWIIYATSHSFLAIIFVQFYEFCSSFVISISSDIEYLFMSGGSPGYSYGKFTTKTYFVLPLLTR